MKNPPLMAGATLTPEEWQALRLRAIFDHCKWDPQCGDRSVLGKFPLMLARETVEQLADMAEALTREALTAEEEILRKPELLCRLGLPAGIREHLHDARPGCGVNRVRVMRFDFHYTTDGWQISEVNADVPGGYVEAYAAQGPDCVAPPDPAKEYVNAICERLSPGNLVALAHATVYSEDRQVMVYLGRELERHGMRVCLLGPNHVRWSRGRAHLASSFATEMPAFVVRLSPAEWLPEYGKPEVWCGWFGESETPLSNPGRAVVLQSKRFPLTWNVLDCDLSTWRRLLPESHCPAEARRVATDEWVLKPAFGRVGEDVAIAGVTAQDEYQQIVRNVKKNPKRWVAQRRFQVLPVPSEDGEVFPCIGVYTVNGKFAGLYGRASYSSLINEIAMDVAVLVRSNGLGRAQ